jgi:hypothetical protein
LGGGGLRDSETTFAARYKKRLVPPKPRRKGIAQQNAHLS